MGRVLPGASALRPGRELEGLLLLLLLGLEGCLGAAGPSEGLGVEDEGCGGRGQPAAPAADGGACTDGQRPQQAGNEQPYPHPHCRCHHGPVMILSSFATSTNSSAFTRNT